MVRKAVKFWRWIPYGEYYSRTQRLVSLLYFAPLTILVLLGVWSEIDLWRKRKSSEGLLLIAGFILIYSLFNMILWTQVRYRIPLHPFLVLLAASGIHALYRRRALSHG
jgi:hypothetical protein